MLIFLDYYFQKPESLMELKKTLLLARLIILYDPLGNINQIMSNIVWFHPTVLQLR